MKILIINASDIQGGAARAAYRLHKALLAENIDSQMLVQSKSSDNFTVISSGTKIAKGINKLRPTLDDFPVQRYKNRSKTLFSSSSLRFSGVVKQINALKPDIVHLHWINSGMIRVEDLAKINAPLVWSLHDMWAFTGGCHYDENCGGYKLACGNCKVLGSGEEVDLSRKVFNRKNKTFQRLSNLVIVGLSGWLEQCAKDSSLFRKQKIINLPNPINTNIFKPFDKKESRKLWSLPQDKKLVLFGAMGATSDPRKGFNELSKALKQLTNENIELVVFGGSKPIEVPDSKFKTHYIGQLQDDVSLVTLYSAVDVMVVPSIQENLSNAIMESLSCATPVVGFDVGGNADMVVHKQNGYLAIPFDTDDLAAGIDWVLTNPNYNDSCENARDKVVNSFDSQLVAQKYIELYEDILRVEQ